MARKQAGQLRKLYCVLIMKRIALLGSTGSIGTQALDVISRHPKEFSVEVLTAHNNADLLIEQAIKFNPNVVVITNPDKYEYVSAKLEKHMIKVFTGADSLNDVVKMNTVDMVLGALVGYAGLAPIINAIENDKIIALANKEVLVVAGQLVNSLLKKHPKSAIIPVDSEHSAIYQCLQGEIQFGNTPEKILLTASGGPFRGFFAEQLATVTKNQALKHPNWSMGAKVTIDSASLMNKGLEVIEAKWLFDVDPKNIEVLVHPQSIVHSAVQFKDGSIKAQLGMPDMRLPIQYAFSYPERLYADFPRVNLFEYSNLTFEAPDRKNFRNLDIALSAITQGGTMPCIMNAANEVVVDAFLHDKISFFGMSELIEKTMSHIHFVAEPTLQDYVETHQESMKYTQSRL